MTTTGIKHDQDKNRMSLVIMGFARALQEVGRVGTFGAAKYTDDGWIDVPDAERRYTDAMLRHLLKEAEGEELDPESGLSHSSHVAWNALARLDLMLREQCLRERGRTDERYHCNTLAEWCEGLKGG